MNIRRPNSVPPAVPAHLPTNIYHLHPLVAGPLETWDATFARIAAMGFSHVCLAPPFDPGDGGDMFVHEGFSRLHPALHFGGTAEQGLALAVALADRAGLRLMLDMAPGQMAIGGLPRHRPDWFVPASETAFADPRRPPHRADIAIARFGETAVAGEIAEWWVSVLIRQTEAGIAGFRCLTLDAVPVSFWNRIVSAVPGALFLAWTPGVTGLSAYAGAGFDLTCGSATRWDGRAPWFWGEQDALRAVAPALACPEPSFLDRLAAHLPHDADTAAYCRLALRIAAAIGSGLFVPMGFEYATARRFDRIVGSPADLEAARRDGAADLSADIAAAIRLNASLPPCRGLRPVTGPAAPVPALLRGDTLVLINPDLVRPAAVTFPLVPLPGLALCASVASIPALDPGEVRVLACHATEPVFGGGLDLTRTWAEASRIAIEAVEPSGDYPAKAVIGRSFSVSADIFGDGHDVLAADLLWRPDDDIEWQRVPMRKLANDRWQASVRPDRIGLYRYAVEAWWDEWGTFIHDLRAKCAAGQDVALEVLEGQGLVAATLGRAEPDLDADALLSDQLHAAMAAADKRPFAVRGALLTVRTDRPAAVFASWYELFPRSVTTDPRVHGTFRSVIGVLPSIRDMGFDVLYFPPIHPIGRINRKGRNNSRQAAPNDVGSPYAIGSAEGGHDAVHPELGTLEDFQALLLAAREHDLEIALDFAVQCAPDHPWVTEHPDWFRRRPDGSIRYAENPPKKYEDIVNPDFYGEASLPGVWTALRDVVRFWADQGVRIFRVDNPHTKPLPFWRWLIADIQSRDPDVLFLAEAFTRPKPMYRLAKCGFSQSYTYFTWRNTKAEIVAYLTELTTAPVADFFRPNFFVNTPDIDPLFLQTSGRAGFLIRAVLAATLSGLWGIYSGFEICEAAPLPGREEYLDSEKYEIRPRDYTTPNSIVAEIAALNRIRRRHPALQSHLGLTFYNAFDGQVILYGKRDPLDGSMILVAVNLDPHTARDTTIEIPLWEFGLSDRASIQATDLMFGDSFMWHGNVQSIRLDPVDLPFRIWRLEIG